MRADVQPSVQRNTIQSGSTLNRRRYIRRTHYIYHHSSLCLDTFVVQYVGRFANDVPRIGHWVQFAIVRVQPASSIRDERRV
jgi:hypothetical protein